MAKSKKVHMENKIPPLALGFVAYSGTGKTTLLKKLIPLLKGKGLSIALVKHSHHHFDIDHPGKDSHTLRKAGAEQVVIASNKRIAWIAELNGDQNEPCLSDALDALKFKGLDLVLVEGFKFESFPKIELHRVELGKPFLYPEDGDIIAVATDQELALSQNAIATLDINQPAEIATFIIQWMEKQK